MINKNTYIGLACMVFMGLASAPLWAEEPADSGQQAAIATPENPAVDHKAEAAIQKGHAQYHQSLATHERAAASVLNNASKRLLANRQIALAVKEEALVAEYEKKALAHEAMAEPK